MQKARETAPLYETPVLSLSSFAVLFLDAGAFYFLIISHVKSQYAPSGAKSFVLHGSVGDSNFVSAFF